MKNFSRTMMVLLFCMGLSFAQNSGCPAFAEGVAAYKSENYVQAISAWETCVQNGLRNVDVLYNLGNAQYREGNLGKAIWAYESALRIDPANPDLNANLELARGQTVDKTEKSEDDNPILKAFWRLHHAMGLNSQLGFLLGFAWFAGLLLILAILVRRESARNAIYVSLFVLGLVASLMGLDAGIKAYLLETDSSAVVLSKSADIMSGPGDRYQVLHELHEGTKVQVKEIREGWANVRIGESINGFVKIDLLGLVK